MKHSIFKKLVTGFCLCVLITSTIVWFIFSSFQKLEKIYFETLERSSEMELATDAQHIGEDLYMIIANALIDRNLDKTTRDWETGKKEHQAELQKLAVAADTVEDEAKIKEAIEAFDGIIRIFEQEMLPLIRKGAPLKGPLLEMDARIDQQVEMINLSLQSVSRHMSEENHKSLREFQRVLATSTRFVTIISISVLIAMLLVLILIIHWIIRPLTELTNAVRIMESGDYHFELQRRSDDEIGLLVDSFQHMSEQVAKRTIELQDLNEDLERRVEERTSELVHANEQLKLLITTQHLTEKELTSSREELRNLTQHLQNIREEERTTIAREIHDELGQLLTALKMDLSWLKGKLPDGNSQLITRTKDMDQHIDATIKTVQRISAELRPGILDDLGLGSAIDWQAQEFQKRTGITCAVENSFDCDRLDRSRSTTVFRIVQETLTNIYRHSEATSATIILAGNGNELVATITDNGKGITQKQISDPASIGLIGMRERVRYFRGSVAISNPPGGGTCVRVSVPLNSESRKEHENDEGTHSG